MPHHQAAQPDLLPQGLGNEAESEILNKLKKNKKSNQKTKTSFEREKEKGQRSGAEVGEDKEKIM